MKRLETTGWHNELAVFAEIGNRVPHELLNLLASKGERFLGNCVVGAENDRKGAGTDRDPVTEGVGEYLAIQSAERLGQRGADLATVGRRDGDISVVNLFHGDHRNDGV